jgi:AcrR family transcriptional regulator
MTQSQPARAPGRRETTVERRREIAAAARSLVAEKGFEGLRTRDIADRVGINVATLHYHVPTKQALVELVGESLRDEFRDIHLARPRDRMGPAELLQADLDDHRHLFFERSELMAVFGELKERASRDATIRGILTNLRAVWHGHLSAVLGAGRDCGTFRGDLDPDAAAWMIISAVVGFRGSAAPSRERYDAVAAEIMRSVRNPADAGRTERPG